MEEIKRGVWEHFKSTPQNPKKYLVIGEAINSETHETLVLYVPLYGEYRVIARPKEMFLSDVYRPDYNNYLGPRFRYVGE